MDVSKIAAHMCVTLFVSFQESQKQKEGQAQVDADVAMYDLTFSPT